MNTWKIGDLQLVYVVLLPSDTYPVRHVMKPMQLLALSILLVTGGCPFGPGDRPPPPDDCSSPRAVDGIDAIEIGAMDGDTFVPWQEGEIVDLTYGSQGGTMLGVVLSLRGSNLPACMSHEMELRALDGLQVARTEYPVRTYAVPDGTRATSTVWMIFDAYTEQGDRLELTLHVGDLEVRRSVLIEAPVPVSIDFPDRPPFVAGAAYAMDITFDRYVSSNLVVDIESSDPAVVQPFSDLLDVTPYDQVVRTELDARAVGGPVIIRVTANGHTIETELTVQ